MLVVDSEEACNEKHLTLGAHAWRVHHLRSLVLICVHLCERELHWETLS